MSDINNGLKVLVIDLDLYCTSGKLDAVKATERIQLYTKQLEAENVRLKKENTELEAKYSKVVTDYETDVLRLSREKEALEKRIFDLLAEYNKLKIETGWQDASVLPTEEGCYAIRTNNGFEWELRLTADSLLSLKMNISAFHTRGYEWYEIQYLKLPEVK